jgi:hypothetical protein
MSSTSSVLLNSNKRQLTGEDTDIIVEKEDNNISASLELPEGPISTGDELLDLLDAIESKNVLPGPCCCLTC